MLKNLPEELIDLILSFSLDLTDLLHAIIALFRFGTEILQKILNSHGRDHVAHFLASFIRGRTSYTEDTNIVFVERVLRILHESKTPPGQSSSVSGLAEITQQDSDILDSVAWLARQYGWKKEFGRARELLLGWYKAMSNKATGHDLAIKLVVPLAEICRRLGEKDYPEELLKSALPGPGECFCYWHALVVERLAEWRMQDNQRPAAKEILTRFLEENYDSHAYVRHAYVRSILLVQTLARIYLIEGQVGAALDLVRISFEDLSRCYFLGKGAYFVDPNDQHACRLAGHGELLVMLYNEHRQYRRARKLARWLVGYSWVYKMMIEEQNFPTRFSSLWTNKLAKNNYTLDAIVVLNNVINLVEDTGCYWADVLITDALRVVRQKGTKLRAITCAHFEGASIFRNYADLSAVSLASAKKLIAKATEFANLCGLQELPESFYPGLEKSCISKSISIGWDRILKWKEEGIHAACYIAGLHVDGLTLPTYIEEMCKSVAAQKINKTKDRVETGGKEEEVREIIAKFWKENSRDALLE